jgi:hypothetical protein
MASWMVHLRIADRLLDHWPDIDATAFVVGNIAPDSGVPNEDWSRFDPPKTVSHFKGDPTHAPVDAFCAKHFNDAVIQTYGKREYSFFLGYYVHLLTDEAWIGQIYRPLLRNHPEEAAADKDGLNRAAKEDWYDLDFLYLEQHPTFRAFSIYENAADFENTFMDIFRRDAFEDRRRYICDFYRSEEHGDLHRAYRYLTPEQAEAFVERTVRELSTARKRRQSP